MFSFACALAAVFLPGKSEIVIAPEACESVRFAASEAGEFLSKSLGAEVPVVTAPTEGRTALVLGRNAWADAAGVTTNGLKRDGYRIRSVWDRVYVVGIDDPKGRVKKALEKGGIWSQNFEHATVFGAYEFLERYAGVRFYFPGELGTVVPRKDRIEVPETDFTDAPDFTVRRYTHYTDGLWFEGNDRTNDGCRREKNLNWWRMRMETEYTPCCHGQNKFKYMERFAKSHPEYFLLLPDGRRHNSPKITSPGHPGQICHTSAVWEEIYQDVKAYLTGQPASARGIPVDWGVNCQGRKYVDIMPQDGMIKCSCAKCQAYYRTQHEDCWASALIWSNTVAVANRLTAEGVSGKVTMMAYSRCRTVPESVTIPDNVEVMVAERGPWTARDRKEHDRELAEIRAWTEKLGGRKVWMWTYVNKHGARDIPGIITMTPRCIGRFHQEAAPYVFGAYLESETDRFLFNYLNYYVFSKVCWRNDVDVDALLGEHYRLMFGAAADEMRRLYEAFEDIWLDRVAGETYDTPLGPASRTPTQRELFTRVYSQEVLDDYDALLDAAERKVASGSLEARRIDLVRREIVGVLKAAIDAFRADTARADSFRTRTSREPSDAIVFDDVVTRAGIVGKAPVRTRVNVWKDQSALHFAFDCEEPAMDETRCTAGRRPDDPETWQDNGVEIFLNPSGDRTVRYQLVLTSDGVFMDRGPDPEGVAWNSDATAKAERTPTGWKGTVDVPLKAFPRMKENAFPMNFARDRVTKSGVTFITWGPNVKGYGDIDNWSVVEFGK